MSSIRTSELARLLGVTSQTIRKYVCQNKIPHHSSPSGQLFFTKEDVEAIVGVKDMPNDKKEYGLIMTAQVLVINLLSIVNLKSLKRLTANLTSKFKIAPVV